MSLLELLPNALMRARTGHGYERGQRYWREGRVVQYAADGEHVTGIVAGADDYAVRLDGRGKRLVAACSCPMGLRGETCKHVVALALHHLAVIEGRAARQALVAGDEPCFATQDDLEAWASEHRVAFELETSAEILAGVLVRVYPSEWHLRRVLCTRSLGEVGSLDGARRAWDEPRLVQATAVAAAAHLAIIAADVEAGLAEERVARQPSDPAIGPAWAKLVELRGRLRAEAMPRGRASRAGASWKFEKDGATIEWHEATPVRGINYTVMPVIARLAFRETAALSCTCKREPCTHAIALVDATLDRFADPARRDEMRAVAEELVRPPWQRVLAELAFDEQPAKRRAAIELWWQVEHELHELAVVPVVKRQLKKGGTSSGTRVSLQRLLAEHGNSLEERDRAIVEALDSWRPGYSTSYPYKAFAALVGHPRVMYEGAPIAVKRFALGFVANESGVHGGPAANIKLEPTVDGARFSPRLLGPLLQTFAQGEPLVVIEPEHGRVAMIDVGDEARRIWLALARHGDTFPPESHAALMERLARIEGRIPIAVSPTLMGDLLDEPATVVLRLRLTAVATLELEAFVRPAPRRAAVPTRRRAARGDGAARRRAWLREARARSRARGCPAGARAAAAAGCRGGATGGAPRDRSGRVARDRRESRAASRWRRGRVDRRSAAGGVVAAAPAPARPDRSQARLVRDHRAAQGRVRAGRARGAARCRAPPAALCPARREPLGRALGAVAPAARRARRSRVRGPGIQGHRAVARRGAGRPEAGGRGRRGLVRRDLEPARLAARGRAQAQAETAGRARGDAAAVPDRGPRLARAARGVGGGRVASPTTWAWARPCRRSRCCSIARKLGPALVLAPTSVSLNWVDELRAVRAELRPVVYGELGDRAAALRALGKKDVLVVSYGLLARDAEVLAQKPFATLVVDEAQALKNPRTQRAKAARMLKAEFRIALSGTPLENHLGELWSLFALVFPGLLGSWEQFRDAVRRTDRTRP